MPKPNHPELYEKAKAIADQKYDKPSAYKSGFIVKTYKSLGGTYSGTKSKKLSKDIKDIEGDGIMDDLNSGFKSVVDKGKKVVGTVVGTVVDKGNQIGNFFSKIVTGSTDYSPSVHKILDAEGNNLIKSIVVGRTPVNSAITTALNLVSQGQFQKNQDALNYDKLFHLFSEITLENGKQVRVEKNEVITMTMGFKQDADTERQDVDITKAISFRDLLENARRKMKQKFFAYDSANNNCQDFIMALLQGSGLGSQENYTFIKQNTKQLFEKIPRTRALAKQITNLGQRINIARQGGKISSNNIMPKFAKGSQEAKDFMASIRSKRGRKEGGKIGENLGKNLAGNLGRLADSGTNKVIGMMGTGRKRIPKYIDVEMEGGNLGKNLAGNLGRLADSGTDKLISMMGNGVHIHHHHYSPHSYKGGNLGYGLSYSGAGPQGRGFFDDVGNFFKDTGNDFVEAVKPVLKKASAEVTPYAGEITGDALGSLAGLTGNPYLVPVAKYGGQKLGDYLGPMANEKIQGLGVEKIRGRGPKGLKKFKKWTGAIGDYLGPIANPILEAGRDKAVDMIKNYPTGRGLKGSQEMKDKMAKIRAMRKR